MIFAYIVFFYAEFEKRNNNKAKYLLVSKSELEEIASYSLL